MIAQHHHRGSRLLAGSPVFYFALLLILSTVPLAAQDVSEEPIDPDLPWSASASVRLLSRLNSYGVDLAPTGLSALAGLSVDHTSGIGATFSTAWRPGSSPAYQRSTVGLEYTASLSEEWECAFALDRSFYPIGSVDPFSTKPTSLGVSLDYDGDELSVGVEYERHFGGDGASYETFSLSKFIGSEGFVLLPTLDVVLGSQTFAASAIKKNSHARQMFSGAITTITGLSSIDLSVIAMIGLGDGWTLSFAPGFSYTPTDLAATTSRFMWSAGVRRAFEF